MIREIFANSIFFITLGCLIMGGEVISATTGAELFSVGWKLISFRAICSMVCWMPCEILVELFVGFIGAVLEDL